MFKYIQNNGILSAGASAAYWSAHFNWKCVDGSIWKTNTRAELINIITHKWKRLREWYNTATKDGQLCARDTRARKLNGIRIINIYYLGCIHCYIVALKTRWDRLHYRWPKTVGRKPHLRKGAIYQQGFARPIIKMILYWTHFK